MLEQQERAVLLFRRGKDTLVLVKCVRVWTQITKKIMRLGYTADRVRGRLRYRQVATAFQGWKEFVAKGRQMRTANVRWHHRRLARVLHKWHSHVTKGQDENEYDSAVWAVNQRQRHRLVTMARQVVRREQQIRGSGGSLDPPGSLS